MFRGWIWLEAISGREYVGSPARSSMIRLTRIFGYVFAVLLVCFCGLVCARLWMDQALSRTRESTLQQRRAQLHELIAYNGGEAAPWTPRFVRLVEKTLDADVALRRSGDQLETGPFAEEGQWAFRHTFAGNSGWVEVNLRVPAVVRASLAIGRASIVLLVLSMVVVLVLAALPLLNVWRTAEPAEHERLRHARDELGMLNQLAEVSERQRTDLSRERNERLRAEEDLQFQQMLLNRSLEEKIRLGHDLHDGVIQSLYAVGLGLETTKKLLVAQRDGAIKQLEAGMETLNATIRELRSYVIGLTPENLRRRSFADCIRSLTEMAAAGRDVAIDIKIEEEASARLSDEQFSELLQIVREALSNSLRHSGATQIGIRLQDGPEALCLLVQDNGTGPVANPRVAGGRGLSNMRARAQRIGAELRTVGGGTGGFRVLVTLPMAAVALT